MVKCGVLFEVQAEFLNTIYMSSSFKGLMYITAISAASTFPENNKFILA
jgi:hypothetical protein